MATHLGDAVVAADGAVRGARRLFFSLPRGYPFPFPPTMFAVMLIKHLVRKYVSSGTSAVDVQIGEERFFTRLYFHDTFILFSCDVLAARSRSRFYES